MSAFFTPPFASVSIAQVYFIAIDIPNKDEIMIAK